MTGMNDLPPAPAQDRTPGPPRAAQLAAPYYGARVAQAASRAGLREKVRIMCLMEAAELLATWHAQPDPGALGEYTARTLAALDALRRHVVPLGVLWAAVGSASPVSVVHAWTTSDEAADLADDDRDPHEGPQTPAARPPAPTPAPAPAGAAAARTRLPRPQEPDA